jgi:hypothetical protein
VEKVFLPDERSIPVVLLANKCDLCPKERDPAIKLGADMDAYCESATRHACSPFALCAVAYDTPGPARERPSGCSTCSFVVAAAVPPMCNACKESVPPNLHSGRGGRRAGTVLCARNHSAGRTALLLGLRRLRRMIRTSRESTPVLLAAPPLPVSRGHAHELTLTRERRPIDRGAVNMFASMLAAGWIGT